MVEIYSGKNVILEELALPISDSTTEKLDSETPDVYVDALSVTVGTAVGENEIIGSDMKIFTEGVRNATVTMTLKATPMGSSALYLVLQSIADNPTSDNCDTTGDRYYIHIELKNKAGTVVAALAPATDSWAACEVGDISFPANDTIMLPLTLRYGKLTWAAA